MSESRVKWLFTVILFGVTGCASVSKPVDYYATPENEKAYIYGKFKLEDHTSNVNAMLMLSSQYQTDEYGNRIRLVEPLKYGFKFGRSDNLQVIEVEPGTYKIDGFQYGEEGRILQKDNDFSGEGVLSKSVTVKAGKTYYMGEWHGIAGTNFTSPTNYYSWKLTKLHFEFEAANYEFTENYRHFEHFPREILFAPEYSARFKRNKPGTYNRNDMIKSVAHLEHELAFKMASHLKSDPEAKAILAYLYEKGLSVDKDFSKAVDYYIEAVKGNSSRAMYRLSGLFFEQGDTETKGSKKRKDYMMKGATYLTLAALHGDERAVASHCRLAEMRGSSEAFQTNAWAWCNIGKKMLTDFNESVFKKSVVIDNNRASYDIALADKIVKQEQYYVEQMKKNGVTFIR